MLPTVLRRAAAASKTPVPAFATAYPTKKVWPPDFKRLTPQEQLRFEKKYKRRVLLAGRRPRFDKAVKLAQLATIVGEFDHLPLEIDRLEWLVQPGC